MTGVILFLAPAFAAPSSADIELVNPTFSTGSLPGADAAWAGYKGDVRVGGLVQYARDPLIFKENDVEIGSAVGNRTSLHLGVSWDVTRRLGVRLFLPLAVQWGGDAPDVAASGIGAGDIGAGLRVALLDQDQFGLALRGDLRFPTGSQEQWLGEAGVRGGVGADFSARAGRFDVLAGASVLGRTAVETPEDFTLGTEASADAAVRFHVIPDRVALALTGVGRMGLMSSAGAGESPAEAILGAQIYPTEHFQVDVGLGHGLTSGYGSSRFRAFVGLTWVHFAPRPDEIVPVPEEVVEVVQPIVTEDLPDDVIEYVPPPKKIVEIEKDQIVIRDQIQFNKSNSEIFPASRPVLLAIQQILLDHPEILEVVIEGHSSQEGDFAVNYDLSIARATAINRALVEAGVDAQRLAVRGLGEVLPISTDDALNRRVMFHIVRRLQMGEEKLVEHPVPIPWTGLESPGARRAPTPGAGHGDEIKVPVPEGSAATPAAPAAPPPVKQPPVEKVPVFTIPEEDEEAEREVPEAPAPEKKKHVVKEETDAEKDLPENTEDESGEEP